jgi:TRAP transporter TAXI family solute receptor
MPLIAVAAALSLVTAGSAAAQNMVMATDRLGTALHAAAAGIASVVTKHSSARIVVSTSGGQDFYVIQMERGEFDLAPISAYGAWLQLIGKNPTKTKYKNMRILIASEGGLRQTFVTTVASGITSIKDLKGKRVTGNFLGTPLLQFSTTAALAAAGISVDDTVKVPVNGIADAMSALGAGRADATWTALGAPGLLEINARTPIRYLPIPDSPEALKILREQLYPGVRVVPVAPSPQLYVTETTPMVSYDVYIVSRANLEPEKVRPVLDALWDNLDELHAIHPLLAFFVRGGAATELMSLPYHPAAVAFYKSKGVWTAAMQASQDKLEAMVK